MNAVRNPERIWLALLAAALLACLALGAFKVYDKHRWAALRLAEIEPRYARLAGLQASAPQLDELAQQLRERMAQYAYPAGDDPSYAGNGALQRVRELAAAAGLSVTSSQALAAQEKEGFYRVGLNLRLEGEWASMAKLLQSIAALRPAVYAESVQINSLAGHMPEGPQTVAVMLNLCVLQERP